MNKYLSDCVILKSDFIICVVCFLSKLVDKNMRTSSYTLASFFFLYFCIGKPVNKDMSNFWFLQRFFFDRSGGNSIVVFLAFWSIFTLLDICKEKIAFFFQFTATHPLHIGEQLMSARDLSVQLLLLAGHFLYSQWQPRAGEEEVAT